MKRVSVLFLAIMLCVSCQSSDGLSFRTFSEKCEDSIVSEKANTAELICNLTYPVGRSKADGDIREWLNQAIMQEFAATHENDDSPEIELSIHTDNLQEAFRDYSSQYYKWVKKEYSDEQGELYPLQPFYRGCNLNCVRKNKKTGLVLLKKRNRKPMQKMWSEEIPPKFTIEVLTL